MPGEEGNSVMATLRHYDHATDYDRVGRFLERTYNPSGSHVNWLQPRWEYMHYTGGITSIDLTAIGIWESHHEIVGVIHPEDHMGTVYVEVDPDYVSLRRDMLTYAQDHLHEVTGDGTKRLRVYINDRDVEFQAVVTEMGYRRTEGPEPMSHFPIPDCFPAISLPEGFRLHSLAEDYGLKQLATATWRGFNHLDDPPVDNVEWRERMEAAPGFRRDLHMMVKAPDGNVASYCGMWYESVNRVAYVEPVCTVPQYRRLGLGTAAVHEAVRRCSGEGATVAYVGSALPFYRAVGFTLAYNRTLWMREWT